MGNKQFSPKINLLVIATAFLDGTAAASNAPIITLVNACPLWSLDTNWGGIAGTSLNLLDAWNGGMLLFLSPNNCIPHYKLTYPAPFSITGVTAEYDAGATITLQDSNRSKLGSSECYKTNGNGGKTNTCIVTVTDPTFDTVFHVLVSSYHTTWNWMGDFKVQPEALPTTSSPTTLFQGQNFTIGKPLATFVDDTNDGFLILLNYTQVGHSIGSLNLSLWYSNCSTPVIDPVVKLNTSQNFTKAKVLIDTTKFASSNLVSNEVEGKNDSVGELNFCVRTEGLNAATSGTSVSFRQDKIVLSYDISSNSFSLQKNTIQADTIVTSEKNVTTTYKVESFRCSNNFIKDTTTNVLQQNGLVYICVKPTDGSPVFISNFEMHFTQDSSVKYEAVNYGGDVNLLSQLSTEGKTKRVVSRVISSFFDGAANPISIQGNAYLSFDTSRSRQLRSVQALDQVALFEMEVSLEKELIPANRTKNSATIRQATIIVVVGLLVFSIGIMFKKMKNKI